jgi:hypothetical protein
MVGGESRVMSHSRLIPTLMLAAVLSAQDPAIEGAAAFDQGLETIRTLVAEDQWGRC